MEIKSDEITQILKQQLANYEKKIDVAEVGTVLSVGDGIARIFGLDKVMMGELLDFGHDLFGLALNLEEDNVGAVLLGETREVEEGEEVKRTGRIIQVPVGRAWSAASSIRSACRSTARGRSPRRSSTRSSAWRPE